MTRTNLIAMAVLTALLPACSGSAQHNTNSNQEILRPKPAIPLAGLVTDAAQILTISEEARISERLAALKRKTGSQIVVVTAASLGGKDVKTFTNDLGNAWGIGRKGYNDGIVLLVAPNERKVRIATGSGLRVRLPDSVCQQIMDRQIVPHFRKGELAAGIEAGVAALADALQHDR